MILKNTFKDVRKLVVDGILTYVQPGETVEGNKIQFDSEVFKEIEKTDLNLVKKKKLKKENKE